MPIGFGEANTPREYDPANTVSPTSVPPTDKVGQDNAQQAPFNPFSKGAASDAIAERRTQRIARTHMTPWDVRGNPEMEPLVVERLAKQERETKTYGNMSKGEYLAKLWDISAENYNSIEAGRDVLGDLEALNMTFAETLETDPTWEPLATENQWIFDGIPEGLQESVADSRNLKDAKFRRLRVIKRMRNATELQQYGFWMQLLGGVAAAGADPLTWMLGFGIARAGAGVVQAARLKKTIEALRHGSLATRMAYGGVRGATYGGITAGAQFTAMSLYDPAISNEVIARETGAGIVGGGMIPVAFGAHSAAFGGLRAKVAPADRWSSFVGPHTFDNGKTQIVDLNTRNPDFIGPKVPNYQRIDVDTGKPVSPLGSIQLGPIGRTIYNLTNKTFGDYNKTTGKWEPTSSGRGLNLANPLGGFAGKSMHWITNQFDPNVATKLFAVPGGGVLRETGADRYQDVHTQRTIQEYGYTGRLDKYIKQAVKGEGWYRNNPMNRFQKKWSHSDIKQQFDEEVLNVMQRIAHGVDVPKDNLPPLEQHVLDTAKHFDRVLKKNFRLMADQDATFEWKMFTGNKVEIGDDGLEKLVPQFTSKTVKGVEGAQDLLDHGGYVPFEMSPGGVSGYLKGIQRGEFHRTGTKLTDEQAFDRAAGLLRGMLKDKLNDDPLWKEAFSNFKAAVKNPGTRNDDGSLRKGIDLDDPLLGGDHFKFRESVLAARIAHAIAKTELEVAHSKRIHGVDPYNYTDGLLKNISEELGIILRETDSRYQEILYPNFGILMEPFKRFLPHGKTFFNRYVKVPDPENKNLAEADMKILQAITSKDLHGALTQSATANSGQAGLARHGWQNKHQWDEMVANQRVQAANNPQIGEFPTDFWEDAYRMFTGEAMLRGNARGLNAGTRRFTTATAQSALGLAGFAQLSDLANIAGRGWYGKMQFITPTLYTQTRKKHKGNRKGFIGELETFMGDNITPFTEYRGDYWRDELTPFDLWKMDNAKYNIGRGIDKVQAVKDRVLGAMSGMNTIAAYAAYGGQKTLVHEIAQGMKYIDVAPGTKLKPFTPDLARLDGYLLDMGLDKGRLQFLKQDWDAHVELGKHGGVKKLNLKHWSKESKELFITAMHTGTQDIMGKAMKSELPDAYRSPWLTALLQLRKFTLVAHEKSWNRGLTLGPAHMFSHMGASMLFGSIGVMGREYIQNPVAEVDEDFSVLMKRAVANIPQFSAFADTSSMFYAPLASFFDTDIGNALHFGYPRYKRGAASGGAQAIFEQVPAFEYAVDSIAAGESFMNMFNPESEEGAWHATVEDVSKIAPAPFGSSFGTIVLSELLAED